MKKMIPEWIVRTAESEGAKVNLTDPAYQNLHQQYQAGTLDEDAADAFEEIEYLRDVINVVVSRLTTEKVESATKPLPGNPETGDAEEAQEEAEVETPEEAKKVEEVPPALPSGQKLPEREKKILPGRTEPDTTKWKEIRFNKRAGKWQVVVTTRTVRSYDSEDEALNAAKKV